VAGSATGPRVGVLAIQGDFHAHGSALQRLGAVAVEVRRPEQLDCLDGLVIPGGESTTITMGLRAYELEQPILENVIGRVQVRLRLHDKSIDTCDGSEAIPLRHA